jgi:hypothetical protein
MYDPVRHVQFDFQRDRRMAPRPLGSGRRRPPMRRVRVLAAALVLLAAVGAPRAAAASKEPAAHGPKESCVAGDRTIGRSSARVFCGPAKATAMIGGSTVRFAHGSCRTSPGFAINIGTLAFDPAARVSYLGILLPLAKPGIYSGTQVSASLRAGTRHVTLSATGPSKVVLNPGARSGTFSGVDFGGKPVKGSFSC